MIWIDFKKFRSVSGFEHSDPDSAPILLSEVDLEKKTFMAFPAM